jgi:two-component system, cell cycle sensor histidine kinase and response regulator CckA
MNDRTREIRPMGHPYPSTTPRKRPTVLIIDDDVDMLAALEIYLEGNGFEVKTANRGVDALRLAIGTDFDAILCDMVMPRMPGDMFFLAVSKVKPHLCKRFVFITGHSAEPGVAAFLAATQQPVLTKPGGINHLLEVLNETVRATPQPAALRRFGPASSGRFAVAR